MAGIRRLDRDTTLAATGLLGAVIFAASRTGVAGTRRKGESILKGVMANGRPTFAEYQSGCAQQRGESKRRDFRSYHPKYGRLGPDAKTGPQFPQPHASSGIPVAVPESSTWPVIKSR